MLTLISATNRPNSYTAKIAAVYTSILKEKKLDYQYFSLLDMPQDLLVNEMYEGVKNSAMQKIENEILIPAEKYIFIVPEYNGSFPGVFKAFIDASDIVNCFHNKKAALVGVADGRAGNLRGMEHLTNILNHIKINVLHLKVPISSVSNQFDEQGTFNNAEIAKLLSKQIDLMQTF